MSLLVKTKNIKPSALMKGFGAVCANIMSWPVDADWAWLDKPKFLETMVGATRLQQIAALEKEYWALHGKMIALMKTEDALQGVNAHQFQRDAYSFVLKECKRCTERINEIRAASVAGSGLQGILERSGLGDICGKVTMACVPGQGLSFWVPIPDEGGIYRPPFTVRLDAVLLSGTAADRWCGLRHASFTHTVQFLRALGDVGMCEVMREGTGFSLSNKQGFIVRGTPAECDRALPLPNNRKIAHTDYGKWSIDGQWIP